MEYNAYSKVNIGLDVIRRRDDGYHELRMVMQTLQLCDVVDITVRDCDKTFVSMTCDDERLSTGEDNLVIKAAKLILQDAKKSANVSIHLVKNIPIAAGLAGGSADAAATLIGINDMMSLGYSKEELMALGVKLGADVPYCIMRGTALALGIGDELTRLTPMINVPFVIAKPYGGVSTADVYGSLRLDEIDHLDIDSLVTAIDDGDLLGICDNMGNVLESVTIRRMPQIDDIKRIMYAHGASISMMSGSGPSVFGIFTDEDKARAALADIDESGLCEKSLITYLYEPEEDYK